MVMKVLLVALSTSRAAKGEDVKRVHFEAGTAQNLTKDEIKMLDGLTAQAGRPHYRDVINEQPATDEDEGQGENETDFEAMTVADLKSHLTDAGVTFAPTAVKAGLVAAAQANATDEEL